jgi:hypothetical protein
MNRALSTAAIAATLHSFATRRLLRVVFPLACIWLACVQTVGHAQVTPIDYYRMSEDDGGSVGQVLFSTVDRVGGKTLNLPGAPFISSDVASSAASSVGSTRSIWFFPPGGTYGTATLLSTANNNFGLEAWVKPASVTSDQIIAYNGNTGFSGWGIMVRSNGTYQALFGGVLYFGSATAAAGTWAHVAVVRDNGTATLYVNGVAAGTTASAPNTPSGSFGVAADPPAYTQYLVGYVDEVRAFTFAPGTFTTSDLLLNYQTLSVTNTNDSGAGSLRQALLSAPGKTTTINISATGTITLASPLPIISSSMTINGPGTANLTVDGANLYRVFFVDASGGLIAINNLTVAHGRAKGGNGGSGDLGGGGGMGAGGGLFVNAGNVSLSGVNFSGNAGVGGNGGDFNIPPGHGGGVAGGGGLGGDGGVGAIDSFGGGGGGGYLGKGGDTLPADCCFGASAASGGGGGITGNGGSGSSGGGGGGAITNGGNGSHTPPANGAGADGLGGNGGIYSSTSNPDPATNGGAGLSKGGGGGGGYGSRGLSFTLYGGSGGDGGKSGGGGGASNDHAGNGGDFGGGGGNYNSGQTGAPHSGGNGGFGGGGGGQLWGNAGGGFGGGGGGDLNVFQQGSVAFGGLGGDCPYGSGGGGGAALAAAIFVRGDNGAALTWNDGSADAGTLTAGTGGTNETPAVGSPATSGATRGSSMFLLGATTTTIAVNSGQQSIAGSLAGWSAELPTFTKTGAGTLILSGSSTDLGTINLQGGNLRVNGVLPAATAFNASNGTTVSGTGSINGPVALLSGASVSPGDPTSASGIGTLDTNDFTWNGGSSMSYQLGATAAASDSLLVSGNLTKAGNGFTFNFSDGASAPSCGTTYTLIQYSGTTNFIASDFAFTYSGSSKLASNSSFTVDTAAHKVLLFVRCNQTITNFAASPSNPILSGGTFTVSATKGPGSSALVFASTSPTVCTVSGSTVTMLTAGTCALTANQAGDTTYNAAPQVTLNVTVGKGNQAITSFAASPASPVYSSGGTFTVSATKGPGSAALVFGSTSPSICTISGSTMSMLAAGTCALTANQAGDSNYNAAPQVTLNVTIAKGSQTITNFAASPASPVYSSGGTFTVSAAKGPGTAALVFGSTSTTICTVSGTTVSMLGAGTCALTANQAGDSNYNAAPQVTLNVTLGKGSQTITNFAATPANPTFSNGGTFSVSATAGVSTSPVVFGSTSTSVCTVSASTVTMHTGGTCALTANQAADSNYNAAPQVTLNVTIAKANQAITNFAATPANPAFSSGGTFSVSATSGTSSSPLVFGSTSPGVCTVSGSTVNMLAAGNCALTADQAGDISYNAAPQLTLNVTIAKGAQSITNFQSSPANPLFIPGGTFGVSAIAGPSTSAVTFGTTSPGICTVAGSTVTMVNTGTCALTADQAGDSNYNAAPTATLNVPIAKGNQAITNFAATPANPALVSGTFTVSATEGASNDPIVFGSTSPAICTVSGSTITMLALGTCALTADEAGNVSYNDAPTVTLNVPISRADQAIANLASNPTNPAYSVGGTFTISATPGPSTASVTFATTSPSICGLNAATVIIIAVGDCVLTADQAGDGYYNAAPTVTLIVTIGKGAQTISNFRATPAHPPFSVGGSFGISATPGVSTSPVVFGSNSPSICGVNGSTVIMISRGICQLIANQAGDSNYNAAPTATLAISFEQHTVTATGSTAHGTFTPTTQLIDDSATASFDIVPAAGFTSIVSGDTCTVTHSSGNTWTSGPITSDCNVTVNFLDVIFASGFD